MKVDRVKLKRQYLGSDELAAVSNVRFAFSIVILTIFTLLQPPEIQVLITKLKNAMNDDEVRMIINCINMWPYKKVTILL